MPRILPVLAVLAVLATTLPAAPASGAAAEPAHADDPCGATSWQAGTVDLCAGTLVYRDYIWDDYGADTDPTNRSAEQPASLSPASGDERYPEGQNNTADLATLRLRLDGDRLVVTFELNTLFEPDTTLAAIAIDVDADPSTGGGPWTDGTHRLDVSSDGWDTIAILDRGDPETNLLSGSLPVPSGDRWRVQAVTAKADGTVMNVAFRGDEEVDALQGQWFELLQADALAAGDVSAFGHEVTVADLRRGTTRRALLTPGLHERVYRSRYTFGPGEGWSYEGEPGPADPGFAGDDFAQRFQYFGRLQAYGVYVPERPGPHGVQLAMHGLNANLASLVEQEGMQEVIGEGQGRIVVVPEGRGAAGFYSHISERDVLDVLDDVVAAYDVDEDRVFAGGYSMGGYGTLQLGALHPDRFAGYLNWVGFTGDCTNSPAGDGSDCSAGALGNAIEFVRNLRHVPGANLYSGEDELVHVWTAAALQQRLGEVDVPHVFYLHPVAEHLTYALADDWEKETAYTADLRRVERPLRVTYRTDRRLWFPELDIRHDRAYWLSRIRPRDDGHADLDVTTSGCGGALPTLEATRGAGPSPVPWVSTGLAVSGEQAVERAPRFAATLVNVASFTIDVDAACLTDDELTFDVTTDGPVTIELSDGRRIRLPAGEHEGTVGAGEASRGAAGQDLPATGGGVGVGAALALVTALTRRRARGWRP